MTVDGDDVLFRRVAIYVGNDEVIEFTTNQLRRITLTQFSAGTESLSRILYMSPWQTLKPEEIVGKANATLNDPEMVGSYDVISNNSEHFVTYCTFGKRLSYQRIMAEKATTGIEANQMECTPSSDSVMSACGKDRPAPGSDMGVTRPAMCSVKLEPISDLR